MNLERFPGLQTFLGGALLLVVLASSIALGANRPISWSLLSLAIFLIFACQLGLGLVNPMPAHANKLWMPVALYTAVLLWIVAQLWPGVPASLAHPIWNHAPDAAPRIGADPGNGQHILMRLIAYGMVFWVALRTAMNIDRAALMMRAIAVFCTLLSAFGIWAYLTQYNAIVPEQHWINVAQATFVNRNSFATYAVIGALANIAVALDMSQERRSKRDLARRIRDALEFFFSGAWVYVIGAILCIGAVTMTQSRGGNLAGIIGVAVLFGAWRGRGKKFDPILVTVLAVMVVFIGITSATGFAERLLATDEEAARFVVYPAVVAGILDRPLLGHGAGSFWDAFRPYLPLEAAVGEWDFAHNSFLQNFFELGVVAASALYVALGLITWRLFYGARHRKTDRAFSCFALAVIAAAGFHSFFDFSLQMPATGALFAAILGLGYGQAFSRNEIKASVMKTY